MVWIDHDGGHAGGSPHECERPCRTSLPHHWGSLSADADWPASEKTELRKVVKQCR